MTAFKKQGNNYWINSFFIWVYYSLAFSPIDGLVQLKT